jgi:protein gp37
LNKSSIEWTDFTWNPVTGCRHGCRYCYARGIARRFPDKFPRGFKPHWRPERLGQPEKRKKPAKIFVCSMADLFGDWMPRAEIQSVIDRAPRSPQHTFQFLTKNPKRLAEFRWPENCWVGATVTDSASMEEASKAMFAVSAPVRFVSAEPLLGGVPFFSFWWIPDWVIVGAQSGPGAPPPPEGAAARLTVRCDSYSIPVFHKDNLGPEFTRREWPRINTPIEGKGE